MLFILLVVLLGLVAIFVYYKSRRQPVNLETNDAITLYVGEHGSADVIVSKVDREMDDYEKVSRNNDCIYISHSVDKFFKNERLGFLLIQKGNQNLCLLFQDALQDNDQIEQINGYMSVLENTSLVSLAHIAGDNYSKYRFVYIMGDYEINDAVITMSGGSVVLPHLKSTIKIPERIPVTEDPLSWPSAPPLVPNLVPFEEGDKFGIKDDTEIVYIRKKKNKLPALVNTLRNLFVT